MTTCRVLLASRLMAVGCSKTDRASPVVESSRDFRPSDLSVDAFDPCLADSSSPDRTCGRTLVRTKIWSQPGAIMRRSLVIGVTLLAAQQQAAAQCRVKTDSNEGKLLAFYTAPIVFSMATAPQEMRPGSIRIGAEGEYIPKPDPAIEQTGSVFYAKERAHFTLTGVRQAEDHDRRSVRLCARGGVPSAGDDRPGEAQSLQLRSLTRSPSCFRSGVQWNDPHVAGARHVWKREGGDNVSAIGTAADLSLESMLRD